MTPSLSRQPSPEEERIAELEAALEERDDQIRRIHLVLGRATLVWEESISDDDIDVLGLLGKWATPRARADEGSE